MLNYFSKSIYYPAGGTDLQILLRLSDICDTVISPTLSEYLTIDNYEQIFKRKCIYINTHYQKEILKYEGYEILQSDFIKQNKFIDYPSGLFSNYEIEQYNTAFSHHFTKDNFVVKFNFIRVIGNLKRNVSWIAMNTEGLATLISLVNLTNEHPKILCTIQSGILEYPNSLFARLLDHLELKSKIWIRGFWNNRLGFDNLPISSFPPYSNIIQDYGFWYSPMGENAYPNEENDSETPLSKVRAFSNADNLNIPQNANFVYGNKEILLIQGDIKNINTNDYDLIITSQRIFNHEQNMNVRFWDSYSNRLESKNFPKLLFIECLEIIRNIILEKKLRKIAITPMGYEDETLSLIDFIENINVEFQLHIFYRRPLDFVKLTAPNSV